MCEVDLMGVALGLEAFDSLEAVAVVIDDLEEDIVLADREGVVVGRMRIELGITLLDSTIVGDPDAVKMDTMLLELVADTELLGLVKVVKGVVRLNEIEEVGVPLELGSELVSETMLVCDAEESALSAVEDVEAAGDGS